MTKNAEKQAKEICEWLRHQIQHAQAQGVILHVDGGLASAVTTALAKRALGSSVNCLLLPCHSPSRETEDARLLVEHLNLPYQCVDLSETHDLLLRLLPQAPPEVVSNMLPRLRMTVLYHFAAARHGLVLGTINRNAWEIGCFTKHGDGAADLFPVIHLLRADLRELAGYLNLPGSVLEQPLFLQNPVSPLNDPAMGFTVDELDSFLAGDHRNVAEAAQMKILAMQQSALEKKRPALKFSLIDVPSEKELPFSEDQEIYGKSIEALSLISKAITSDHYLEDILRLIVMVTAEVMNSSVCSLWLLDEKENVLRLRATQSIDREYLKDRVLKVGEGVVGKVVAENRPYIVADVLKDPFFKEKELARRMRLVSMLSMPMRVKDRVIGVINCYTSHPHIFSDLQLNLLTAVANQAAVAIEKTELIVQTKVIQEELEKRKLIERAKDLLMKRLDLPGEEAYRWLQKRSMNTRKSMREVAEAVLLTMEA